MRVQIRPTYLVSALNGNESAGFSVNSETTSLFATQNKIAVDSMKDVSALKPYVKLDLSGGGSLLMVAVRFQCLKDGQLIHSIILDRRYLPTLILEPQEVPDIRPYQTRNRILGSWSLTVDITFFAARLIKQITPSSYPGLLAGLRYQRAAAFEFQVVRSTLDVELTPTGRMVEARHSTGSTYTINDL